MFALKYRANKDKYEVWMTHQVKSLSMGQLEPIMHNNAKYCPKRRIGGI